MRDSSHVHELNDDESALVVYRVGDASPTSNMIVAVNTGREWITLSIIRGLRAFTDDECHRRALRVVLGVHLGRNAIRHRACPRHGCHDEPVR